MKVKLYVILAIILVELILAVLSEYYLWALISAAAGMIAIGITIIIGFIYGMYAYFKK